MQERHQDTDSSQHHDANGGSRRRFGRARIAVVAVIVCMAALLVGEQVGAARSWSRRPVSRFSAFAPRPPRPTPPPPSAAPGAPANAAAQVDDGAVLAQARGAADSAVGRARSVTAGRTASASGTAAQFDVRTVVCPVLLQVSARLVATFNSLIARFPQLAPQLIAIRDSALATINQLSARFGCNISLA